MTTPDKGGKRGGLHRRGVGELEAVAPHARVGDVGVLAAGRKGDACNGQRSSAAWTNVGVGLTVGHDEAVSHNSNGARRLVETVHLPRQTDGGAEVVGETVAGVGEVDLVVAGVDGHVVERVELAAEEVVEEGCPGVSI